MGGKRGRGNPGANPGPPPGPDGGPRPGTGQGDAFDADKVRGRVDWEGCAESACLAARAGCHIDREVEVEAEARARRGGRRQGWRLAFRLVSLLRAPQPDILLHFQKQQGTAGHPRKRFYRARAHANPLNDGHYADLPDTPGNAPWAALYPEAFERAGREGRPPPRVAAADVGCGFGGLLVRLAPHLAPGELAVGIELRDKVCDYVRGRAAALRAAGGGDDAGGGGGGAAGGAAAASHPTPSPASTSTPNRGEAIAALRVNAQRHLPALFPTRSLARLFFLFPDPHFKARAARRRIVTPALVGEYAALVAPGGILYTATDVEELGGWMRRTVSERRGRGLFHPPPLPQARSRFFHTHTPLLSHDTQLDAHPMYRRLAPAALAAHDPAFSLLTEGTEEGQKVARARGRVWVSCYVRLAGARCPGAVAADAAGDAAAEKGGGEAGAGWEVVGAAVEAAK